MNVGGSILTQVGGVNYPTFQDAARRSRRCRTRFRLNSRGEISNSSGVSCQLFLAIGVVYTFTQYDAHGNQINQASWMGSGGIFSDGTLNRVVDSIAVLRTLSKLSYTRAFVTGYYAPHDGGGGAYQYDPSDTTSVDNGGTIIVASDGGRWKLQVTSSLSPRQFGVKGDGSVGDQAMMNAAIAAAVSTGLLLLIDDNMQLPQMTVTGTLRMKATGKVTVNYNGANGAWMLIPAGADNSHIEFDELDFNSQGVNGIEVMANYCTVIVRDAHSITAQDYAIGNRQGVVISEGVGNVVDVTAYDLLVGTSTQGSIPRIVTTDTGSSRNLVRVNGNNCWVGWCDNGTDNTAEYVVMNQCGGDGIYNLAPSVNMKCDFLQITNSQAQPFVLEGANPYIGTAVYDGWGFPGVQGCTNAVVGTIQLLPTPDGTPSQPILRSRTGNTTADIRIGRIIGSLNVGLSTNGGALFQFLVGSVNYVVGSIDLSVSYLTTSTATNFVTHAAGTNVELGDVRIRFNDSAAQPGSPLAWQTPTGAAVRVRKWDLDAKSYNYIILSNVNLPTVLLPNDQELSSATIVNPSASFPAARTYFGTAAPTSGTWNRGDVVYNKFAALGGALGWKCIAAGSPGTWKIMGQAGVLKAATTSRPTASTMGVANDADWAGTQFFDTTLVSNGKLRWWTGAQWVDATGTAV